MKTTEELELELKAREASKPTQDNKGGAFMAQETTSESESYFRDNELLYNLNIALGYVLVDGKWVDTKPRVDKEYVATHVPVPVKPVPLVDNVIQDPVKGPVITKAKLDRWEQMQLDKLTKNIN